MCSFTNLPQYTRPHERHKKFSPILSQELHGSLIAIADKSICGANSFFFWTQTKRKKRSLNKKWLKALMF